ncbi:type II secretion system protein GspI [Pseudomonas soli]|uniref:Type II secretion system protein I n=1 Tax=Pseudomonas soli TaxID=1306993 RepID=A0ABU7GJY7_9PSED|nr:type II secretion system minor pseudopilin GspI [Pseudomonas soli]MDT3712663.1 type II secretion system minor pseudopilin GspI [Pseudomonas soli]MDT3730000.1 type II secretion system minor pseudopilin GspI [Pseudomonas soli]MEE1879270.1 type II secretion system minor pseudopilin GspI [Pseudomonas soli]NBK37277.1 type II secretion system protein GspI [Pseudomonas soli]WJO24230.1 type II secretion system minor pseudopilin GspI [Pseudomonas soli]
MRATEDGFTLIEVLVALTIVAVAMAAAVRASGLMTQGNGLLRDKALALLAAQGRLSELRLEGSARPGVRQFECDQGRLRLRCEQRVSRSPHGLLEVSLQVFDNQHEGPALARLQTLLVAAEAAPAT